MWRLLALLLFRALSEECPTGGGGVHRPSPRIPRTTPALVDIIGLDEAKALLREAVVLPLTITDSQTVPQLFWRSTEQSALLLCGAPGLGKAAAVEAAAAAAGAQVLPVLATEAAAGYDFCGAALAIGAGGGPVVVLVEALETAPSAAMKVRDCMRSLAGHSPEGDKPHLRVAVVATLGHRLKSLSASLLTPFGYVAQIALPDAEQRKRFLQKLLAQVSRVDPKWASALPEAAFATLANQTSNYTFAEIDLVVRRAFLRSMSEEGVRDPVALHHFETILAETPARAAVAFEEAVSLAAAGASATAGSEAGDAGEAATSGVKKKKSKESKDPMEGIFGWCNMMLPEALHLPPVVWAMIIFGIMAHFMARSTYHPGSHKRRGQRSSTPGGPMGFGSIFGDPSGAGAAPGVPGMFGAGAGAGGAGSSPFGSSFDDWYSQLDSGGLGSFPNFPPPPSMPTVGTTGAAAATATAPASGAAQ
eukprot:gnl/TRDRNA2_/TRDRNA2_83678_c0_seq1.p1 gnl/TRDRNA2_/TRDRNA2_83678_c0~~gnl/TRDRNA2_/TRDRNA2_83678_c0_seq1.p1  ORF type:complete len:476 (+),score=92.68 gnl/TRDRNA2_/TRDRNA2_83678_c0_seq1:80-1507(+)